MVRCSTGCGVQLLTPLVTQTHLAVRAGAALPVEVDHAGALVVAAGLGRLSREPTAGVLEAPFDLFEPANPPPKTFIRVHDLKG